VRPSTFMPGLLHRAPRRYGSQQTADHRDFPRRTDDADR
jgi:hypothetical protein